MTTMEDTYYGSVDPGLTKTGMVIWRNARPWRWETIKPMGPKYPLAPRLIDLQGQCRWWLDRELPKWRGLIRELAMEWPYRWTPKKRFDAIAKMQCAATAVVLVFAQEEIDIHFLTKKPTDHQLGGRIIAGKEPGRILAESLGIPETASEHVCDACHLGILRGYDRRERR